MSLPVNVISMVLNPQVCNLNSCSKMKVFGANVARKSAIHMRVITTIRWRQ